MRVLRFRPTGRSVGGSGGSRGWWSGQAQRSSFCVRVSHGAQRPPGPRGVAGVRVSFWEWSSVWVDGRPSVCSPADRPLGFREPSCREHGWASRSLGPVPGGAIPDLTAVLTFWGAPHLCGRDWLTDPQPCSWFPRTLTAVAGGRSVAGGPASRCAAGSWRASAVGSPGLPPLRRARLVRSRCQGLSDSPEPADSGMPPGSETKPSGDAGARSPGSRAKTGP